VNFMLVAIAATVKPVQLWPLGPDEGQKQGSTPHLILSFAAFGRLAKHHHKAALAPFATVKPSMTSSLMCEKNLPTLVAIYCPINLNLRIERR
jgi:hypothetical protein